MKDQNADPGDIGRGMILYIRCDIEFKEITHDCRFDEIQAYELFLPKDNIVFVSIYRSPSSPHENNIQLNNFLRAIGRNKKKHILCGDMNFRDIDWDNYTTNHDENSKEHQFLEAIKDSFLEQHIDRPTRVKGNCEPSLLDLLLTDKSLEPANVEYTPPLGKGDHCLLQVKFNIWTKCRAKVRLNFKKGNYPELCKSIRDISYNASKSVEENWNYFKDKMNEATENHIPKMKIRQNRHNRIPISSEIFQAILEKEKSYRAFCTNRTQSAYEYYCKLRNKVRKITRINALKHEEEISNKVKSNPKVFWNHVNSKLKPTERIPTLNLTDGTCATTDTDKAEALSRFFSSVFTKESPGDWNPVNWRETQISDDLVITEQTVLKELESLDITKSMGPDNLNPRVLHETRQQIAPILTEIFTESWQSGELPPDWKYANISAIHKKDSKSDPNNYRPISLTAICCKIMEKIVKRHIINFLVRNHIICDQQYGFVPGRSTTLQLLRALEDWTTELDAGNEVDIIYIDFQKAFDSVPHKRLLHIIEYYGIRGKALDWITAFLSGRKQRVIVNESHSQWADVTSGVPQGSVLGPVLFLLYINSMANCVSSKLFLFADDAKVYRAVTNQAEHDQLQKDLYELKKWSNGGDLEFNLSKCHQLTLSLRTKSSSRNYSLDGKTSLRNVSSEKDLGVIIDSKLSFHEHISKKTKTASGTLAIIKKCFLNINADILKTLYKTLVRPHLEYANQSWKPYLKKHILMIENVQRRATRLVPGYGNLSYEDRLRALNIPTLEYRRRRGRMIEVFKILNECYDRKATEGLFELNERETRGNPYQLKTKKPRLGIRRNFFTVAAVADWNSLPEAVVRCENVNAFKRRLDEYWEHEMFNTEFLMRNGLA